MASYVDFNKKIDTSNFDYRAYLYSLPEEKRQRIFEERQSVGLEPPTDDGFFSECGQAFAKGFVNSIRWVNKDYFTEILNRNQQWNAPADCSAATEFARGIGFFFGISWIAWIILFTGLLIRYRRVFSKYHKKIEKLVKSNTVSDDKKDAFYAIALEELENNQIDKITWAKAMATQGSNNDLTKSAYIKLRVEKLEKELIKEQKNILD